MEWVILASLVFPFAVWSAVAWVSVRRRKAAEREAARTRGVPLVPNGDINLKWDDGPNKLFRL